MVDVESPSDTERSMVEAAAPSVEDLLAETSGRTRSVWVCPDGELLSSYQEKVAELEQAGRRQGGMLSDPDDVADMKAEVDGLAEQVNAKLLEVKMEELRPGRVREVRADHFLGREEAKQQGRRQGEIDMDAFLDALARESIVEIAGASGKIAKPSDEHVDALLDRSNAIRGQIRQAVEDLHGQGADPKEQIAIGRHLTSDRS